ncbi:MAG: DNA-binding response regulator [Myxococcales bacterium]|nr:DNA-binding response regulator [Myxococcales bacterium]|tara:strand:+ start:1638 stop:2312 length:675 start_codon:yes stop_codon:yes gene_type:complete
MKILLVEDDLRLGEQLKPEIERAGHHVHWARDARTGLSAFLENEPDVVLLDLMLPDGSGYTLLKKIRVNHTTPVIVISARSLGEDKVRALDLGADDYVTKPFWTNELTARIRAVVRRLGGSRDNVKDTAFGNVVVDMVARQVAIDGTTVALTPTEFELLRFFIERPKQALRRERIIDSVFRNPDSATEALQTHISRLRKKLGNDGSRIETVWGIGYRFNTDAET